MLADAYDIVRQAVPGKDPECACMLVAAAVAGMRGLTMRHVRVGALFWPEHFEATGDVHLSVCGGWGIFSHSPSTGEIFLHEEELDEDGGFRGHTWVEDDKWRVIDLMHGVDGGPGIVYRNYFPVAMWHRRPTLERRVKSYWRMEMQACAKAGRKWAKEKAKCTPPA